MEPKELGLTVLRALLIYVFLLIMLRILGKRSLGDLSAFDFIITLIMGRVAAEPITGRVPVVQALVGVVAIAAAHYLNSALSARSTKFYRLTAGDPREVIRQGRADETALLKEHISLDELMSLLRQQKIKDLGEVERAIVEPDGKISVFKQES